MKIDITKPITVTASHLGKDYLEFNLTLEDGKEIEIAMLATSMAGCGVMMTEVANRVIAKQIAEGHKGVKDDNTRQHTRHSQWGLS